MLVLEIIFWLSAALIVWTQLGYALALAVIARLFVRTARVPARDGSVGAPSLSLIVAAHDEQSVIAAKVENALALDYPRDLLELIVACDGCSDATAQRARQAGADVVLELPRGGKIRAQDAAVRSARGRDRRVLRRQRPMGARRRPRARRRLRRSRVGYACGQVRFCRPPRRRRGRPTRRACTGATRWPCVRCESRLRSITAGNGAIYATRREAYLEVDPIMGHDLSFPFNMVKRGWRAVYVPPRAPRRRWCPRSRGSSHASGA